MTRVERAVQAAAAIANKRKRQVDRKKRSSIMQRLASSGRSKKV